MPGAHFDSGLAGAVLHSTADVVSSAPELARLTLNIAATHHDWRVGGQRLVYGGHTIGLALAQATRLLPNLVTVLGWESCDHTGPVHEGDTLYSELHVEGAVPLPDGRGGVLKLRSLVYAVGRAGPAGTGLAVHRAAVLSDSARLDPLSIRIRAEIAQWCVGHPRRRAVAGAAGGRRVSRPHRRRGRRRRASHRPGRAARAVTARPGVGGRRHAADAQQRRLVRAHAVAPRRHRRRSRAARGRRRRRRSLAGGAATGSPHTTPPTSPTRARLLGLPVAALGETPAAPPRITTLGAATTPRSPAGLLVADLSSMWAGPLCGQLLAQAGAIVVKVESPRRPDGTRAGPPAFFDWMNGGKLAYAVDFDEPQACDGCWRPPMSSSSRRAPRR